MREMARTILLTLPRGFVVIAAEFGNPGFRYNLARTDGTKIAHHLGKTQQVVWGKADTASHPRGAKAVQRYIAVMRCPDGLHQQFREQLIERGAAGAFNDPAQQVGMR